MPVILSIAFRNLREHRLKTVIIASLIALGMFLLVLGNSIIDTGKAGIHESFVRSFSGDILVGPPGKDNAKPSLFGGGFGGPNMEPTKTVPDYKNTYEYLKAVPGVEVVDPQVYGAAQIELTEDWRAFVGFFGVDIAAYSAMFPDNLEILQGHFLAEGEEGVMIPEKVYLEALEKTKVDMKPGEKIKLMGFGGGTKIKFLPVAGVFRFKSSNTALRDIGFMDISSLRYLQGMVVGAVSQIKIDDTAQNLMDSDIASLDSFFDDDGVVSEAPGTTTKSLSQASLDNILGDTSNRAELVKADAGAWHYILLRTKDGVDPAAVIKDLNADFKSRNMDLVALDWEGAAGVVASFVVAAQTFFLILVIIISIVSVIVIMNTMVVSIIERTAEIGTMRALGANKSYIRKIFMTETFTLSVVGGLIGLVLAGILLFVLNRTGLPAPHSLFEIIFGGKIMHPVLSWVSAAQALGIMLLVGIVSSLYPTMVALRIQPVKAMQSN